MLLLFGEWVDLLQGIGLCSHFLEKRNAGFLDSGEAALPLIWAGRYLRAIRAYKTISNVDLGTT